jgi:nucleoside-triphosphatase
MPKTQIIFAISGWRSSGKSPFCQRIIQRCRTAGFEIAGILSPARIENGLKNGFFVTNLSSGETRLLASKVPGELLSDTSFGPWKFDQHVFNWGNQNLRTIKTCDLLVIDELGPLELKQGKGWLAALESLQNAEYKLALVVVRPECLDLLKGHVDVTQVIEVSSGQMDHPRGETLIADILF